MAQTYGFDPNQVDQMSVRQILAFRDEDQKEGQLTWFEAKKMADSW